MTKPRSSAAVVLTRGGDADLEVYLVRRSPRLRFFGDHWAFPGGVLDHEDHGPDVGTDGAASSEHAFLRCAVRELFEETGVLPASLMQGLHVDSREVLRAALLSAERPPSTWNELVTDARRLGGELTSFCHIVTPPFSPLRYATRFFHMECPVGEDPMVDGQELVEGRFVRPRELFDEWLRGGLLVVPPTLFLLEALCTRSLEEGLRQARRAGEAIEAGRLLPVRNSPGVFTAPLRTPTLPPATTTNCYLVGESRVYIVDPATWEEEERSRLFDTMDAWIEEGRRFEGVLVTHHHRDHVGSVAQVARRYSLPVLGHPLTLERLPERPPDVRPLEDGDVLPLGRAPDGTPAWMLRVLHTPGHDRGHLAFLENRYRGVIVGDLVSTISTIVIDPPEGHLATYLSSLGRLLKEDIAILFPAHGMPYHEGQRLVRHYLAHRAEREESLVSALRREGRVFRAVEALLQEVYQDTDPALFPLAERSLRAGLEKLAEDGRAEEGPAGWRLCVERGAGR